MHVASATLPFYTVSYSTAAPNASVRAVLDHIAQSTRLTPEEKKGFTLLLADIGDATDPTLMIAVMTIIGMAESGRAEGSYLRNIQSQVDAHYWSARGGPPVPEQKGGIPAPGDVTISRGGYKLAA